MLTVRVKYLGVFVRITRKKEESISLEEGSTVGELKTILSKKYGRKFTERFSGFSYRNAIFLRNGEAVDEDAHLSEGDGVVVAHPVGGG